MLFPIAARVYCAEDLRSIHTDSRFEILRGRYSSRLHSRQYFYKNTKGRRRGGVVVSDKLNKKPSKLLFQPPGCPYTCKSAVRQVLAVRPVRGVQRPGPQLARTLTPTAAGFRAEVPMGSGGAGRRWAAVCRDRAVHLTMRPTHCPRSTASGPSARGQAGGEIRQADIGKDSTGQCQRWGLNAGGPAHGPATFGSGCYLASARAPGLSSRSARTDLTDRLREGGATEVAQAGATAAVGGVGSGPPAEVAMPSPGAAASAGAAISGACSTSCRGRESPNR